MSTPIESLLEETQEPKKSYAEILETVDKTQLETKGAPHGLCLRVQPL